MKVLIINRNPTKHKKRMHHVFRNPCLSEPIGLACVLRAWSLPIQSCMLPFLLSSFICSRISTTSGSFRSIPRRSASAIALGLGLRKSVWRIWPWCCFVLEEICLISSSVWLSFICCSLELDILSLSSFGEMVPPFWKKPKYDCLSLSRCSRIKVRSLLISFLLPKILKL